MQWIDYSNAHFTDCLGIVESVVPQYVAPEEIKDFTGFLEKFAEWGCRYGVVAVDGQIIACGGLGIEGSKATLCWGLVHAQWHRRRVGSFMLEERLKWAQAMPEVERVELTTSQHTYGFFEGFGFETTGIRKEHYSAYLDGYSMVKRRPF